MPFYRFAILAGMKECEGRGMSFLNWIIVVVPKNLLSFWAGKIMHINFPKPLSSVLIRMFAHFYKINVDEAEKSIETYLSIGDFFIRRLKKGVRPIAENDYVHPADSKMTARGVIREKMLVQAKGRLYSFHEFLMLNPTETFRPESNDSKQDSFGQDISNKIQGYFITYYLCPTDYHRVHSPVDGWVKEIRYIPGQLWPVNDWSVSHIDQLFIRNERVVIDIQTLKGLVSVVLVGATNVGSIKVSFEPELRTNATHKRQSQRWSYVEDKHKLKKGEEIGMFCMGSTVIVVAHNEGWKELERYLENHHPVMVKMGSVTK